MEIILTKKDLKKALSVFMALLIAMSTMWMGLSAVEFSAGAIDNVTDGNVTSGNVTNGNITDGNLTEFGQCGKNVKYQLYDDGRLIIYGKGKMYNYSSYYQRSPFYNNNNIKIVIIEDGITSIGEWAFYNCYNIERVIIGNSITHIGKNAFYGCINIKGVYAPDVKSWLQIRYGNFDSLMSRKGIALFIDGKPATEVVIPDGITTINSGAFYNCDNLRKITIPDSVVEINRYAFYSCNKLEDLDLPDNLASIGDYAFYNCDSFKSVVIPDCVTDIGSSAFRGCNNLVNVKIGKGLTSINNNTFYQCDSLETLIIPENITNIGNNVFYDCDGLKSVEISDSVTSLGLSVFRGCNNLENIKLSDNIKVINDYTFYNCDSIKNMTIPDSVTAIGSRAFYSCDSLESVTIPDSVVTIGSYVFSRLTIYCNRNSSAEAYAKKQNYPYVLLDGGDEVNIVGGSIGKNFTWSLDKRTGLLEVIGSGKLPYFTDESPAPWEEYRDYITQVNLPEGLLIISSKAFENLNRIKTITIPDSVTIIDSYAFYNCYRLESVTIPDNVTTIGSYAFYNCTSLESVTIGDSVTTIDSYAFYNCTSLESVYVSDAESWLKIDFAYVDDWFGSYHSSLLECGADLYFDGDLVTDLVVPEGITEIKEAAFYNYDNLKSVTIPGSVTAIDSYAFYDCDSLETIVIPEGVTKIEDYAFAECSNLKSVELPSTVDFAEWSYYDWSDNYYVNDDYNYIFNNCKSLETVKFNVNENYESKITYIPSGTFTGCSSLKEIVLPASVKFINSKSFPSTLEKITIYNPECEISLDCGITYNSEIVGFKGSTAETFADTKAAYFTDIETIHAHSYKVITDTQPTCTEDGLFLERCSCGKENKEVRAKKGHDFKDYEVTLEPTCTSYGQRTAFCKNCDHSEKQSIAPTYHLNRENRPQQNPTCTAYGYTSGVYCSDCETWLSGHVRIDRVSHTFTEKIIDKAHLVSAATAVSPAVYKYDCAGCDAIGTETFTYGEADGLGKTSELIAEAGTDSVNLTWQMVNSAKGYILFSLIEGSWEAVAVTSGTSYTFNNVTPGTKNTYAVLAYGSSSLGIITFAKDYAAVQAVTKASVPSKITAAQNNSAIKLSWNTCTGATGYRIYYKSGSSWKVAVSSTTKTSHTFTGLKAGAKFTFAVRPYVKDGSTVIWSDYKQYTACTTPANPATKAASSSAGKVTLQWNVVNGADGYRVYYKTGNGAYKLYNTYTKAGTLTFSNLKSGTKYTFAVRAGIKTSGGVVWSGYNETTVTVK